jgi:hypothetical protein
MVQVSALAMITPYVPARAAPPPNKWTPRISS